MLAYIYIHFQGEIVEKYQKEIDTMVDLEKIFADANAKYKGQDDYCFDVMIV